MEVIFDEEVLRISHVIAVEHAIETIRNLIQRSSGETVDDFRNEIKKLQEDTDGSKFIEALRAKLTTLGEFMNAKKVVYMDFGSQEVYLFTKGEGKILTITIGEANLNDGRLNLAADL